MTTVPQSDEQGKVCTSCKNWHPYTNYYVRSGITTPTQDGHYNSHCKDCMKTAVRKRGTIPAMLPYKETERFALDYLHAHGIPALPGKAVAAADVDVVAFGCVWIEVKWGVRADGEERFAFPVTPKQAERGFLAHVVMLICDYEDERGVTVHLFDAQDEVFYIDGRLKHGFTFRPGAMKALKHGENRVVMTQPMMDAAQDNVALVEAVLARIRRLLADGAPPPLASTRTRKVVHCATEVKHDTMTSDQRIADFKAFVQQIQGGAG